MRHLPLNPALSRMLILLSWWLLPGMLSAQGASIVLVGQNDPLVDRIHLQEAIDSTPSRGMLKLRGTFQLDGGSILLDRGDITLQGWAEDNDGDGRTNEDWADGVDNDEDGLIDEDGWDTVIQGIVNPDGLPAGDIDVSTFFNRGLMLQGFTGAEQKVAIRNIEFRDHNRALSIQPDFLSTGSACPDFALTGGSLKKLTIQGNLFVNNFRSVQIIGSVEQSDLKENTVVDGGAVDLLLAGGSIACFGTTGPLPIGTPHGLRLRENLIRNGNIAIFGSTLEDTEVKGNVIEDMVLGIFMRNDTTPTIKNNAVSRTVQGITVFGPATQGIIRENLVVDSSVVGIFLLGGATGFVVKGNTLLGSASNDIFLDSTTFGNLIFAHPTDIILDAGENTVIIEEEDLRFQGSEEVAL